MTKTKKVIAVVFLAHSPLVSMELTPSSVGEKEISSQSFVFSLSHGNNNSNRFKEMLKKPINVSTDQLINTDFKPPSQMTRKEISFQSLVPPLSPGNNNFTRFKEIEEKLRNVPIDQLIETLNREIVESVSFLEK